MDLHQGERGADRGRRGRGRGEPLLVCFLLTVHLFFTVNDAFGLGSVLKM